MATIKYKLALCAGVATTGLPLIGKNKKSYTLQGEGKAFFGNGNCVDSVLLDAQDLYTTTFDRQATEEAVLEALRECGCASREEANKRLLNAAIGIEEKGKIQAALCVVANKTESLAKLFAIYPGRLQILKGELNSQGNFVSNGIPLTPAEVEDAYTKAIEQPTEIEQPVKAIEQPVIAKKSKVAQPPVNTVEQPTEKALTPADNVGA